MLHTTRLLLRPYLPEDWERVHLYASLPEFSQFDMWGPNSLADTKKFIKESIEGTAERPILRYELAVILKAQDILIGGCTLKRNAATDTEASLGFAINPSYQRNGYATEATVRLIQFAFEELHVLRVFAECDTRNIASRGVMEKAGMQLVGLLKNHQEIRGMLVDSYRYEILPGTQ